MPSAPSAPAPAAAGRLKLRTLLMALSLLGTVPMLGFALALLWQQWTTHQDEMQRSLRHTANALAMAVERELKATERQLGHIAGSPSLQPPVNLPQFHRYMQRLVSARGEWDNLALVDPQAGPLLDTAVRLGAPLPTADPIDYGSVAALRTPTLSNVYVSAQTGRPAVAVSLPVERNGQQPWILTARLAPMHLRRLLQDPPDDQSYLSTLMDRQGVIAARSQDFERFFGLPASADLVRHARERPQGVGLVTTPDGRQLLMAWQRLENDWTVSVGIDPAVLEAPWRESLYAAAGAGGLLLLLGLAGASWLASRISISIEQAADDAIAMARGDPVRATYSPIAQVNQLFVAHHEASRRLEHTAQERNEAMARMQGEVRRRDEFLSMLAHELRNPLAPLFHALWILERSPRLDAHDRQRLCTAHDQARQLNRLVDDLLDASRLVSGKITLRPAPLALRELVARATDAMQPVAEAAGQRIVLALPDDPVPLMADGERLRQVLHNLLGNALKFGREGDTVRVTLQAGREEVVLSVRDEGLGIEPGRIEEMFLPFSQIDPGADRSRSGLGLGLTIARQLVQMHGGTLQADSAGLGHGAVFTVRLPREPAFAPAAPAAQQGAAPAGSADALSPP